MNYTFNGTAKTITLPSGAVTLDLVDLHARWKDWVLLGNAQCLTAFRAIGGDIPAIPLYLFLLNGWRVVPQAADHTLTVSNGVFEVEGGGDPFINPVGTWRIRINRNTPGIAIGYSSTGDTGGGFTGSIPEIAAAVRAELALELARIDAAISSRVEGGTIIQANTKMINDVPLLGRGTKRNPWRPQE